GDGLGGVQADEVGQPERAHGVGAAVDHAVVDVLDGGEAGLEHADGGEDVRDQQGVDDEAGAVLGADDDLSEHVGGEGLGVREGLLGGEQGGDELDQLEDGDGVEEVDADHLLRAGGGHAELHDGDGGGVGREDRIGSADRLVQGGEHLYFDLLVLRD